METYGMETRGMEFGSMETRGIWSLEVQGECSV